jgi:peptide/nickel transport system ATP-binding protein
VSVATVSDVTAPLLEVADLSVTFSSEAGPVSAVRSLSYRVQKGEVLGIVGESGSGKTVSSLAIMELLPRNALVTGSVRFQGTELIGRSDEELSDLRGRKISMIFQDPLSALTPVYTVGDQIAEAILVHSDRRNVSRDAARARAIDLLALVGIPNRSSMSSPVARQRAMIAMAIANDRIIIADEPTTALDVTIQAQIRRPPDRAEGDRRRDNPVTHDLGVVAGFGDRVAVIYRKARGDGRCR